MYKKLIFNYLMFIIACLTVLSCEKKQENQIILTRDLRIQIDTTANRQISLLGAQYDSICKSKSTILTQQFTDSLVQLRKQLIQEKMMQ